MAVEKINIERFLELAKHFALIDVRSPGEYGHAYIPGAYNLPLFTDDERRIVGTSYKQENRETAIKIGLDFFGPRMKKMVEEVELIVNSRESGINNNVSTPKLRNKDSGLMTHNSLLIYCWRGGMRSAGVAWLMDLYGFKVYTLAGGYKKFRNYVLNTFKIPFEFNILGGYTGSGKTEILKALEKGGESIIDLEEIAKHKGSAFGNIGLPGQPTQEMFENMLALDLRQKSMANDQRPIQTEPPGPPFTPDSYREQHSPLWLEDESQRIGDVNIPHELWKTMRTSRVYFLEIPFEERLKHVVEEYGALDKEKLLNCIVRIQKRLGGMESKNSINFLLDGNITECFRILLKYYDKWYLKSLHNRENINSLLRSISYEKVEPQNTGRLLRQTRSHEKPVNS